MTETDVHLAERGTAAPASATLKRPRWAAFWVILVATLLMLVVPIAAGAILPSHPKNVVGVYERAMLQTSIDDREVIGGFIAPQGWQFDPDEGEFDEAADERTFSTLDHGVVVTASMHAGVESSKQLLQESAPVGAALVPLRSLEAAPLLEVNMLEYDLEAGAGVTQLIAVCETLRNSTCMLFEVSMDASRVGADADPLLPDIAAIVASTEVQP